MCSCVTSYCESAKYVTVVKVLCCKFDCSRKTISVAVMLEHHLHFIFMTVVVH